jgi:hypothetical protein
MPPEPKPRAPAKPRTEKPTALEEDVSAAVLAYLRQHPRVAWFMRINSGAAKEGDRYIAFYRLYLPGVRVRSEGVSDYLGQLKNGRTFLMECKREGKRRGTHEQEELIAACVAGGGVAGIVQSIEDAQRLMGDIQ